MKRKLIMMSWNLHKLPIVIFGITQYPLWIKASKINWRNTKERTFLNIYGNLKRDWFEIGFKRKIKLFWRIFIIHFQNTLFPTGCFECMGFYLHLFTEMELVSGAHFLHVFPQKSKNVQYETFFTSQDIKPNIFQILV